MIWMKFEETAPGSALDHSSFEVLEASPGGGISGNGASADKVEAVLTAFDPTDAKRVTATSARTCANSPHPQKYS
jgi:hypothetical protein